MNIELQSRNKSNLLFVLRTTNQNQMFVSYNEIVNAAPIPSITDNKTNMATCYFIAVNPASKNLKETLQYISSLSKYMTTDYSKIMAKDRSYYPETKLVDDLYKIYENGEIVFTYPKELFKDDFIKYLAGEKDIDSVIEESDRRLDIYLIAFTVSARKIHVASLPRVKVTDVKFEIFEVEEYEDESGSGNTNRDYDMEIGIPKELYDNYEIYILSSEMINGEIRTVVRNVTEKVEIGRSNEVSYEILKGLYGMNKIIIDGFENIQDGCEVYVINE